MVKKDYKARLIFLLVLFFIFYAAIIIRVFLLQLCQKDFFKFLGSYQYKMNVSCAPLRGSISDRNGKLVSLNEERLSAFIFSDQHKSSPLMETFLGEHFEQALCKIQQGKAGHFMWLERKIPQPKEDVIKKAKELGVHSIYEPQRFYPSPSLVSVIGVTDIDNKGIAGLELMYTSQLQGAKRKISLQKDARFKNLYFEKAVELQGAAGKPLQLTIDSMLQFLVTEELQQVVDRYEALVGSVLIMDPDTGEVIVMANYPSIDPNEKIEGSLERMKNNIVNEAYEMGSVMKVFAALSALEEGVVEYDEIIDCEGKFAYIDGFRVQNPTITLLKILEQNKNKIPFYQVVRYSSNVGIAKVVKRLGDKLYDYLRLFGFGRRTGIGFPGERSGFINHPSHWSRSSSTVMSFGYEITATVLQLGAALSMVANGGYSVQPMLVKGEHDGIFEKKKLFSDFSINHMRSIMGIIGKKFPVKGYHVMGKTGTARMAENGTYSKKRHVYTFAGIVERDNYRRVVVTFVREPKVSVKWASQITAPLFQKVAEKMVLYEDALRTV